jgi:CCR4-NOT transcription complex subunit 1
MVSAPVSVAPTPSAATPASATTPTPSLPSVPPEPRFSYLEINSNSLSSCLNAHLAIPNLQLFQVHSQLKQCIRPAVERAIQEWIHPVVDRSIKIALTTCEQIVKKVCIDNSLSLISWIKMLFCRTLLLILMRAT